jgi:aspartate racemase
MQQVFFGIVGNMGPEADIAFQDRIRKASIHILKALIDQEHINTIIVKNAAIPDRSKAINEGGTNPVSEIVHSLKTLEKAGVSYAAMPCNTAHYYKTNIQAKTHIHILDMLEATAQSIFTQNAKSVVGILATTGTCNMKLYDNALAEYNIAYFKPNPQEQEDYVHAAIYGTKTGDKNELGHDIRLPNGIKSAIYDENAILVAKAIEGLIKQGCNTILLGCTELPLVEQQLKARFSTINFVDPMTCTAEKAVKIYDLSRNKLQSQEFDKSAFLKTHSLLKSIEDIADYVAALTNAKSILG